MEQKQRENEEYIARKNAEIAKLEEEHEELKAKLQELQLVTEESADMKKMIISYQTSAEESIAALREQMHVKYVDIGKSLNERMDLFLETSMGGILLLEKEHEELKTRQQELQLVTEEIADMKKMIISNQKSAEESIAALREQMLTIVERMVSFQTSMGGILLLEKEHEELKTKQQELQLVTEEKNAQDLKTEIADMKKMIISNQKSAEESIAALGEQIQTVAVKYVDIGKSLNERMDLFLETSMGGIPQIQTDKKQSAETSERTLMYNLKWKEYGTILVLGGAKSNKMHLLNIDRTRWCVLSLKVPTSLNNGNAVYLDGEIYIFDGFNSSEKTYKLSREMKWIQLADMNEERWNISNSSVVFDDCIWVFGGYNQSEKALNSVEKYIPEENKWIQMPSMNENRYNAAAAACKGKLFVSGGSNAHIILRNMECFDPASQKWTMFLDLPSPMEGHAMISDGICLIVLGGANEEKSVRKINPNEEKATWKMLPPMRESRRFFTSYLLGDNIFAIGGDGGNKTKMEIFNGETWEDGPELPKEIEGMCSIVIPTHLATVLSSHQ